MGSPDLFDRLTDLRTLQAAWKWASRKDSAPGVDAVGAAEFERALDRNLRTLQQDLQTGRYVPEPLRQIEVPKAAGKSGRRTLRLPALRDKVAQQAARQVIEPLLEPRFLDCSYGYRPGKGARRAVRRVCHLLQHEKCSWIATADIDDFFGTIDHRRLLDGLRPVLRNEAVLELVELWMRMGAVDGRGRWHDVRSGISQGGVISPLLANFYLHPFDEHMVGRGYRLVRYADDFVILSTSQGEAGQALEEAATFLGRRLGLKLNPDTAPVASHQEGFSYLGVFFRSGERLLDPAKKQGMEGFVSGLVSVDAREPDEERLRRLNRAARGWRNYYGSLLSPSGVAALDAIVTEALTELVREGVRAGRIRTLKATRELLARCELIQDRSPRDRREEIDRVAREGFSRSPSARVPDIPSALASRAFRKVKARKQRHARSLVEVAELVVDAPGRFVGLSGNLLVVRHQRRIVVRTPLRSLRTVTLAAHGVSVSSDAVSACARHGIPILMVTSHGQVAALAGEPPRLYGERVREQVRWAGDESVAFEFGRRFAEGKIRNQRALMKYHGKYRKARNPAFSSAHDSYCHNVRDLLAELRRLPVGDDLDAARKRIFSVEGRAGAAYWAMVRRLLEGRIVFEGRSRRGARDPVNMLLITATRSCDPGFSSRS